MASTLFFNSMNLSTTLFSRSHLPFPITKDIPLEFSPYFQYNYPCRSRSANGQKKNFTEVRATVAESPVVAPPTESSGAPQKKLRILIAGGGIGGLVLALAAKKKGFEVMVFEKDLSAIRGEGQYRGPIQIQSNALAALEAIDLDVAEEVMKVGCITGDRINGLVDGVSGTWYIKFDTFTPAAERGLPVTRVISRMALQQILARAVGEDIIMNDSNVVSFEDRGDKVIVKLENGQSYEGDILVGADGIWSKVRKNLFGPKEATYSGYTCYTGIADFVPADIDTVGYRVFLGHKQYFVSSDVGAGKMQWYAFHKEPPGGVDSPRGKKERLLKIFEGWCDNVIDLILSTDEEAILRRDIYDRVPTLTWGKGRVTLLGDSIHAMQPNMGQGGCMAIEDSYQLAMELDKAWSQSIKTGTPIDVVSSLKSYERARRLRVAVIHGMARMAALMASTYKAYLGVGLGPLSFLTKFRIPHPGRVGGRFFIDIAMPLMLTWVLGGNSSKLEGRSPSCRLSDRANDQLRKWFEDDDALERAISGEWFLLPHGNETGALQPICLNKDENEPYIVGSISHENFPGLSLVLPLPQVSKTHARISYKDGAYFLTDLRSEHGSWISDNEGKRYRVPPNLPTRFRPSDVIEFGSDKKAAFRVKVIASSPTRSQEEGNQGNQILQAA
ncbi:zeaxanthin epoxidase, chloroplastic [Ziziphus jujuba]|uniref:Zeaxanthin epoxidase, chloroplastic n=1 Tax=Ziziphus jujuba TaxID=326968 RepID=A0A6P4AMU2_ZIZJJ|nr:zeaxanthin epoxidase, chloroplastic [Ziziphus jujuba]